MIIYMKCEKVWYKLKIKSNFDISFIFLNFVYIKLYYAPSK